MNRPSWDSYFLTIAHLTSQRSNCIKRKVGCIIVKDHRILSLGYNGTPRGTKNCFEGGCARCANGGSAGAHLDLCMCLHAEENAMLFVSQKEIENSIMYITLLPCISCVKKILQCGIKKVIYEEDYSPELDELSIKTLMDNNVEIVKLNSK